VAVKPSGFETLTGRKSAAAALIFLNNLYFSKFMYPLAHMYMLNKLVNKGLGRHLDKRDAEQAMGVWLLDAIVTQPLRAKDSSLQGMFHSLDFDFADPLQVGMRIHVYCDNLANFNTLTHEPDKKGEGFLSKREDKLYIPGENSYAISDDFRRRILQCGIDMLVVKEEKDKLKKYFNFATDWAKKKDSRERIYDTFVSLLDKPLAEKPKDYKDSLYETLKDACEDGLMSALIKL